MKKIIHHLRRKDEKTKRDILNICTVVFAFVLILLWLYISGANFANSNTQARIKEDLQPFVILKNNMTGQTK